MKKITEREAYSDSRELAEALLELAKSEELEGYYCGQHCCKEAAVNLIGMIEVIEILEKKLEKYDDQAD